MSDLDPVSGVRRGDPDTLRDRDLARAMKTGVFFLISFEERLTTGL